MKLKILQQSFRKKNASIIIWWFLKAREIMEYEKARCLPEKRFRQSTNNVWQANSGIKRSSRFCAAKLAHVARKSINNRSGSGFILSAYLANSREELA